VGVVVRETSGEEAEEGLDLGGGGPGAGEGVEGVVAEAGEFLCCWVVCWVVGL
jgi:hypothetical protein